MDPEDVALAQRMARGFCRRNRVSWHDEDDYVQQALLTIWLEAPSWDPDQIPREAFLGQRVQWRLTDLQRKLFKERETSLDAWIERDAGSSNKGGLRFDEKANDYSPLIAIEDDVEPVDDRDAIERFMAWFREAHPHRADALERYLRLNSQAAVAEEMLLTTGTVGSMLWAAWHIAEEYWKDRHDLS